MYRTVLKLTKTFGDAPGPRRVADSVKSKIDKFKVHIPLLQIICNPGLRERHWEQVKGMSTLLIDIFGETAMPDPDLEIRGEGGGHPDPLIREGPPLPWIRYWTGLSVLSVHPSHTFFLSAFRKLSNWSGARDRTRADHHSTYQLNYPFIVIKVEFNLVLVFH